MTPFSVVKSYQHFGWTFSANVEAEGFSEILVSCYQTTRRQNLEGINLAKVMNVRHLESPNIVASGQCSFRRQSHSAGWSWCAVFLRFMFRFSIDVEGGVTMSRSWPSLTRERACVVTGVTVFVGGKSLQLMCMCRMLEVADSTVLYIRGFCPGVYTVHHCFSIFVRSRPGEFFFS